MQITLSAVLHKDNLSLISILLCLYFHQGFTELAHPGLLSTAGHFGTGTEAERAHQTKWRRRDVEAWSLHSTSIQSVTPRCQSLRSGRMRRMAGRQQRERTDVTPSRYSWNSRVGNRARNTTAHHPPNSLHCHTPVSTKGKAWALPEVESGQTCRKGAYRLGFKSEVTINIEGTEQPEGTA